MHYLPKKEKDQFLTELLDAIDQSTDEGNFDAINFCLDDWEETVDLLKIPGK